MTVPARETLLATYPVVHPVACHVPLAIVMVCPVMIPVEFVSIPAHVTLLVASVRVAPAAACKAPSQVIAAVNVNVAVALALMVKTVADGSVPPVSRRRIVLSPPPDLMVVLPE